MVIINNYIKICFLLCFNFRRNSKKDNKIESELIWVILINII